jgi:hypothetical protein
MILIVELNLIGHINTKDIMHNMNATSKYLNPKLIY